MILCSQKYYSTKYLEMKTQMLKFSVFLSVLMLFFVVGCQKDATPTTQTTPLEISAEKSVVIADQIFDALNGLTDSYFSTNGLKAAGLTCPSLSANLNAFPIVIALDWGAGCTGADDGVKRSGKISVSLSGLMKETGSVATFSFSDFVSDGNKISGVHRITYKGLSPNNNWPRYAVFTEAKIVFADQKFMTYRAEYVRLQSEGSATATPADDVWRIEGAASGKTREGVAWTAKFPSAVVKKMSCKWFSSGSVEVKLAELPARTINFGEGTCDNKATLKIGDVITNIEL